ncbi:MAG: HAD-IA family hydrolase [Rhodocyclales bacterium]|nr:HAD-IA family hydrolase [Rhodocyclales bacterium]
MYHNYDLIVFDWDGTLMDSAGAIVHAILAACRDLGLPEPTEERARYVIGLGLADALAHAVPELSEDAYPEMVARYRHHYLSSDHQLVLFPGVFAMIEQLAGSGRMLGVATGKSRVGLNRALGHSGLGPFFRSTRCADECFSKPHPAMLHEIMDELGVVPERTLMVGDTTHDLDMASNAGVAGLGVSFGAHAPEALAQTSAVAVVDTPAALAAWLSAHA